MSLASKLSSLLRTIEFPHSFSSRWLCFAQSIVDNPFGDDPNDFNCLALANTAFEDIYLFIRDTDGPEWADLLLDRMRHTEQASYQMGRHIV